MDLQEKKVRSAQALMLAAFVLVVLLAGLLGGDAPPSPTATYTDFRELDGKLFAEQTGTISETIVARHFPGARFLDAGGYTESLLCVSTGKADACLAGGTDLSSLQESFPNLVALPTDFAYPSSGFLTSKTAEGEALIAEFNAYLAQMRASGGFAELEARWFESGESETVLPDYSYTGEKGELFIGITASMYPSTYMTENGFSGFEVDIVSGFCAWAGYKPRLEEAAFSALCVGLDAGKYDLLAVNAAMTDERREKMTFSDPIQHGDAIFVLVRGEGGAVQDEKGFFDRLASSFEKNFVRENRWRTMLSGLGVTMALALCAAILGTMLGALICLLRMSKNPYSTGFARMYIKLFQGMPIVVLLLLLYYVIFGKSSISAFIVCALGFSLDFSAYTSEIFRAGIESVPPGQQRAALALGFSKPAAFRSVVLPQAMRHILPVYRGQFAAMVKTTAVAGYISVQDLTKVSDIIRSRTYEAFFPLITTAVIYFLLAALLVSALKLIELRTDPLKRGRMPKGVKPC